MKKFLDSILRWLFILAAVCIVVGGVVMSYPKYVRVNGLLAEHERILRRIAEKENEIKEIRTRQQRFNNDREFVESLARQNRRVFPGELVFVFDD